MFHIIDIIINVLLHTEPQFFTTVTINVKIYTNNVRHIYRETTSGNM